MFSVSTCILDVGYRENGRETENPKVSGYSAKSLLSNVDFPVPEGPDTTTGRNLCTAFPISKAAGSGARGGS